MADKTPDSVIQEAYTLYIKGNTLSSIAKLLKVSMVTLCKYKKKQNWAKRKESNNTRILQKEDTRIVENAKKRQKRHEAQYQLLQEKGKEALTGGKDEEGKLFKPLKIKKAKDAAEILDMGIKGERLVMGDDVDDDKSKIVELTLKLPIDLIGRISNHGSEST